MWVHHQLRPRCVSIEPTCEVLKKASFRQGQGIKRSAEAMDGPADPHGPCCHNKPESFSHHFFGEKVEQSTSYAWFDFTDAIEDDNQGLHLEGLDEHSTNFVGDFEVFTDAFDQCPTPCPFAMDLSFCDGLCRYHQGQRP